MLKRLQIFVSNTKMSTSRLGLSLKRIPNAIIQIPARLESTHENISQKKCIEQLPNNESNPESQNKSYAQNNSSKRNLHPLFHITTIIKLLRYVKRKPQKLASS